MYKIKRGIVPVKAHRLLPRGGESGTEAYRFKMRLDNLGEILVVILLQKVLVDVWNELPEQVWQKQ